MRISRNLRSNVKTTGIAITLLLALYWMFTLGYSNYEIDGIIKNTKPEEVWNYVADFSKMRILNPTIINFKILSDAGHTHDWRYSVEYTERLSYWPHWLNTARANYKVLKSMPDIQPQVYSIESQHITCFFKGLYCLHSESKAYFMAKDEHTYCNEKIRFECPPFLTAFCRRELEFQRKAVMHNLTVIFHKIIY